MHYKKNKLSPLGFDPGFLVYKASGLTTEPGLLHDILVKNVIFIGLQLSLLALHSTF